MICFIDSQIFTIFVTQCSITVFSGRIKRESGVNPGQSRCCKLSLKGEPVTLCHCRNKRWEGGSMKQVRRPAKPFGFYIFEDGYGKE